MSDTLFLGKQNEMLPSDASSENTVVDLPSFPSVPSFKDFQNGLIEADQLVDDLILKKYLYRLTDLEIIPLDEDLKQISAIRLFKITEMVYQKDEYSTYKFASVFNSVQSLNCGVFIIADSDGQKTEFYMGVRSLDDKRTTKSLKDTLRNAFAGQFPGVKTTDLLDSEAEEFLSSIPSQNIASVSCVAKNKDESFIDNSSFIQGLEKLVLAMQGQKYTAVILAKSTPVEQLEETRNAYEMIYTQLSPFANMQVSYGSNAARSISDAFSHSISSGSSHAVNSSYQKGTSYSKGTSQSFSTTKQDTVGNLLKSVGSAALAVAGLVAAPLTGGASIAVSAAIGVGQIGISAYNPKSKTDGKSTNENLAETNSESHGETDTTNTGVSDTDTHTEGTTTGTSQNMQLNLQNKSLIDTLERIDAQLKRIDECDSIGMWECAAYFLSDSQETAEMAAGTYKAIMKGDKSGVETSSINYWGQRKHKKQVPILREYLTNFIHPVFEYHSSSLSVPVTAASLVSSNELAIQMGLPRKSVCGFPVIEHADFGREVVSYYHRLYSRDFVLGKVFSMGKETATNVNLDCDSLAMHTFITGSTGSGKSNAIYEILNQLRTLYNIPFLVIEPAKGEYKNIFGQFNDVSIFGTNPKKTSLLRLNPFRFPDDVHILEHLDRLVEIFNVCWPMYAAMPAILKEAMEQAYVAVGWNLSTSENRRGKIYPNFADLLEQIEKVINESKYSADSKGDYSGALLTRVRSLTNGLNGMIFTDEELNDEELFDKCVIVDLSRVGSTETKSLIMGLLVMKLNEYRMSFCKMNSPLAHITVLEEAHNLLKRTSSEQFSESSNLLGKSVELLANSIAEMRTYGEGFIIADQSPGLLDMSVIRNTNTKIILRLPDISDRELVGYAAGLKDNQIEELSKLKRGVAAVYQNDWVEPVLVQIGKCTIEEKNYDFDDNPALLDLCDLRIQLIYFLVQGRVTEKLDFTIDDIERSINLLHLSDLNTEYIKEQIVDYKENKKPSAWDDDHFRQLTRRLTDILGVRNAIDCCIRSASSLEELTDMLKEVALRHVPNASDSVVIALSQLFMKDMSIQQNEPEFRDKLYKQWYEHVFYCRRKHHEL